MRHLAVFAFLKIEARRCAKVHVKCPVIVRFSLFIILSTGYPASPLASGTVPSPSPAQVNRTVPPVEPPKTALEFSASPTEQELFRARIFEEPLVPVGDEPSAVENAALAAALLEYSNRSSPDDFSSLTGAGKNVIGTSALRFVQYDRSGFKKR